MKQIVAGLVLLFVGQLAHGAEFETVDVRVTHLARGAGWKVRYELQELVDQLRFVDDFGLRRHDRWKTETPGFHLVAKDGNEYIEREDGKPFRAVTLRFASDSTKLDKKYPLNRRFTDGSEWLCTLHLYAAPLRGGTQHREAHYKLRFIPASGESIVLDGRRTRGAVDWVDPHVDRGTFVYFGKIAPIETRDVIAIVDPGLPAYLEDQFHELLPKLFATYRERTGYALRKRPVIFITYHPQDDLGQGDGGEVLPDVMAFDFRSRTFWATRSPRNARMSFHLLAHEVAHLWNGSLFESVEGNAAPWMHEGGADAFDWAVARDFGIVDERQLREEIGLNLNRCALNLALLGISLREAFQRQYYEFAYVCGSVMNMAVDAALSHRGGQFPFWRALFAEAEKSQGRYSVELYLDVLATIDAPLADSLRELWSTALPDPARHFEAALTQAGVAFSSRPPPLEFARRYTRALFDQFLIADCPSDAVGVGITENLDLVVLHGDTGCRTFRRANDSIVSVEGHRFAEGGRVVYSAAADSCSDSKKVDFGLLDGGSLTVDCPTPLKPLPPYLSIEDWPAPGK